MRHSSKEVLEDLKIAAEKVAKITKEEAEKEATFLYKWSKGKPIRFRQPGSTFWSSGKWMTKLTQEMVAALVEFGFAKELRRGPVGWIKEPSMEAMMTYTAPPPDVEGITEIVMNKPKRALK
jgi:hypothetical protein